MLPAQTIEPTPETTIVISTGDSNQGEIVISYADAAFIIVAFSGLCAFFGWVFGSQHGYMEGHTDALRFAQHCDRLVDAARNSGISSSRTEKKP